MTENLKNLFFHDAHLAHDPLTGQSYHLTGPAMHLLDLLKKGSGVDALLGYLLDEYDVDPVTACNDLDAFLETIEKMKWLKTA